MVEAPPYGRILMSNALPKMDRQRVLQRMALRFAVSLALVASTTAAQTTAREPTKPEASIPAVATPPPLRISKISGAGTQAVAAQVLLDAYQRAGIAVDLISLPALRAKRMLEGNELDGEAARIHAYFEQNLDLIRVEPALMTTDITAFAKADRRLLVRDTSDLRGLRVGILRGIFASLNAVNEIDSVEQVSDARQLYQMLDSGRIDVVIDSDINQRRYALAATSVDVVAVGVLSVEPVYHGLHHRHTDVAQRIAQELDAMQASGVLAERVLEATASYLDTGQRLR